MSKSKTPNKTMTDLAPSLESMISTESGYVDFIGFPYLLIRYVPGGVDMMLLPDDGKEVDLYNLAWSQTKLNGLDTCLVLSLDRCVYLSPDGRAQPSDFIPPSDLLTTGYIKPVQEFERTKDFAFRIEALDYYLKNDDTWPVDLESRAIAARPINGLDFRTVPPHLAGDITVGRRDCPVCGGGTGYAWNPGGDELQVIWVSCRCENDNLCAACRKPLGIYKLNSYFRNNPANAIWHYSGFGVLGHKCT